MFSYIEIDSDTSFEELKRRALIRRADKLMDWLRRPEYAVYVDDDSTDRLLKLIKLVVYALEMSLPPGEWKPFYIKFIALRQMISGFPEHEKEHFEPDERVHYEHGITALLRLLERYKAYILGKSYLT